jgi:UDP-N-acetylmuramoylalanine-D-glutamate ligase
MNQHEVHALLIGEEAHKLAQSFDVSGFTDYEIIDQPTMNTIVQRAHEIAQPGSVVLLSPSAASFGLFKNYADRGDQFIAAVNEL